MILLQPLINHAAVVMAQSLCISNEMLGSTPGIVVATARCCRCLLETVPAGIHPRQLHMRPGFSYVYHSETGQALECYLWGSP